MENYNYVPEELPDSVREFDAFISGSVQKFVKASEDLGDPISEQVIARLSDMKLELIFVGSQCLRSIL